MAYELDFATTSGQSQAVLYLSSLLPPIQPNDNFEFILDYTPTDNSDWQRPIGGASLTAQKPRVLIFSSGVVRLTSQEGSNLEWSTALAPVSIDHIRFVRINGVLDLYVNNQLISGTKTGNTSSFLEFGVIGGNYGGTSKNFKFRGLSLKVNDVLVTSLKPDIKRNALYCPISGILTGQFIAAYHTLTYYYDWLNEPTDTPDYGLKLTTASETVTLPLIGAYDVTVTYADDTTANYTGTGSLVLDGTTPVHIKHIIGTDSEGNVYFDGNNDSEVTNLPELIQGKHGVLSGLPTPSGYVLDANGVVEGYALNDAAQSISYPLVGAWSGVITYVDGTTDSVSGTDTYVITGATPKQIKYLDVTTNYFDHTTGDADQIIDTVGGNHATIVNAPTSGYLPVVERQVFDANDYTQLENFVTGEAASAYGATYLNGKGKAALEGFTAVITNDCLPAEFDTVCTDADNQDFIIATDPQGINRLPVEKIAGSNVIWTRFDRYGNKENDLYVLYGKAGESQPAVDALYGRNAVWQGSARKYHLDETIGTVAIDSSGNSDGTYEAPLPRLGTNGGQLFSASDNSRVVLDNVSSFDTSAFTISTAINPVTNTVDQIISADAGGSLRAFQFRLSTDRKIELIVWNSSGTIVINGKTTGTVTNNQVNFVSLTFDGSSYSVHINGIDAGGSFAVSDPIRLSDTPITIGKRTGNSSESMDGEIFDAEILSGSYKTSDYISAEYANQSNPTAFWTTGEPQDATGTGFSRVVKLTGKLLESTVPDLSFNRSTNDPVIIDNLQGVNEKIVFTGSAGAIHIKNSQLADVDASASTALVTLDNCEVGDVTN